MAYTAQQIVALALQIAKVPGYSAYAGELLNSILEELWQVNDFAFSRKKTTVDLTGPQPALGYPLPSDHQRTLDTFYTINGQPTIVTQIPIEEYDNLFQGVTTSSYPQFICVDVSQTPHTLLAYPIPPLAVGITMRYLPQKDPITTPETSSTVPWFTQQLYLITRLATELMMISDDTRRDKYLLDCERMLSRFLTMGAEDRENYVRTVKLDPRSFRSGGSLRPTKTQPL